MLWQAEIAAAPINSDRYRFTPVVVAKNLGPRNVAGLHIGIESRFLQQCWYGAIKLATYRPLHSSGAAGAFAMGS
jgi:hypothetical protein